MSVGRSRLCCAREVLCEGRREKATPGDGKGTPLRYCMGNGRQRRRPGRRRRLGCAPDEAGHRPPTQGTEAMQIRLTINGKATTATLVDNATARDFLALLPMSATLE